MTHDNISTYNHNIFVFIEEYHKKSKQFSNTNLSGTVFPHVFLQTNILFSIVNELLYYFLPH